jgi:hypothetical protein
MQDALRNALWNRAVAVVFALPAVGYLAFLSQFWLGEPTGLARDVLGGVVMFALPVMILYSALLDVIGPVDQTLGTVGFFVFTYLFAVVSVLVVRRGVRFVRGRLPPQNGSEMAES